MSEEKEEPKFTCPSPEELPTYIGYGCGGEKLSDLDGWCFHDPPVMPSENLLLSLVEDVNKKGMPDFHTTIEVTEFYEVVKENL
jgi:hypothetical protein